MHHDHMILKSKFRNNVWVDPLELLVADHYDQRQFCALLTDIIQGRVGHSQLAELKRLVNQQLPRLLLHDREQRQFISRLVDLAGAPFALVSAIAMDRDYQSREAILFQAMCRELRDHVATPCNGAGSHFQAMRRYTTMKCRILAWENSILLPLLRKHRDWSTHYVPVRQRLSQRPPAILYVDQYHKDRLSA